MISKPTPYPLSVFHAAALVLFLGSCSADESGLLPGGACEDEIDRTERPLSFHASMEAEVSTRSDAATRADAATTTATALETGTLAVYRTKDNDYTALSNIPYTWNDDTKSWQSAAPTDKTKTIYVDHRDAKVYAYYPHNPDQTGTIFNLSMARNSPATTMLYAAKQTVNNRTPATFQMKSGYSRVTFRITNSNLPAYRITKATVTFASAVNTKGTIDIGVAPPTTTTTTSNTANTYDFSLSTSDTIYKTGIHTSKYDDTCDLLMIPGQPLPKMTFTIELSMPGATSKFAQTSATISENTLVIGNMVQGKQYIVPLYLSGSETTLGGTVPVLSTEKDKVHGEDKLTAFTLPPVTVAEGLNVATGNLYYYESVQISKAQNPNFVLDGGEKNYWYCFSGRSGKMWPEKDQTPTNTFSNPTTTNDLCKRLGPNWSCPTAAQLQRLAGLTKTYKSYTEDKTAQNGWWIGTGEADTTKNIFLQNGTYLAMDDGYLTVNSSNITYQAGTTTGFIRCVSDKSY